MNSLSFPSVRFNTSHYSSCFIPVVTKIWNDHLSVIVVAEEPKKFKFSANAFLLGVDGS